MVVRAVSEVGKSAGEARRWPEEVKTQLRGEEFEHGWRLSWDELGGAGGAWLEPSNQAALGSASEFGWRLASHAAK